MRQRCHFYALFCSLSLTACRRETDEEFRQRLLGSDAPQMQRIVTGVDPRLADQDESAPAGDTWGTRLDKLADEDLSPEDREAKRSTHLWKIGNKAKEFGYKWKVSLIADRHSCFCHTARAYTVAALWTLCSPPGRR